MPATLMWAQRTSSLPWSTWMSATPNAPVLRTADKGPPAVRHRHQAETHPTWLYKQAHRLTQEMVEIRSEREQTGALNSKKQRENILKLLDKWYPQANAFEAKLKPYDEQLQRMRDELIRSRSTMFRALDTQEESQQQNLELMDELRACQTFIDSIPQDLLEQIKQRQAQRMEQGQGQQPYL